MTGWDQASVNVLWGMLFVWALAGAADYVLHWRARIERNAGWRESVAHLLEWGQLALPAIACLFFELNSTTLSLAVLGVVAHTATSWWDTRYAQRFRHISATEQLIHAFMVVLPIVGATMVFLQAMSNGSGAGIWHADWLLRCKATPASLQVVSIVLGVLALSVLPIVEETIRGLRWARRHRHERTG